MCFSTSLFSFISIIQCTKFDLNIDLIIQCINNYPGASQKIVLYTQVTKETQKRGCFFQTKCDSCESRLKVKMCIFLRKKVFLDSIKGRIGVLNSIKRVLQRSLIRGNVGAKLCEIFDTGCFSWGGEIRIKVCFRTCGHECVQHQYLSSPRE